MEESIRLVGGIDNTEGRVEICLGGQWGTVCDDGWNAASAYVACQSLGIPGGETECKARILKLNITTYY